MKLWEIAETLYSFGRLLELDDLNDIDRWFADLVDGHLHHGLLGFLLQRFSVMMGLADIAFTLLQDDTQRALEDLISGVGQRGVPARPIPWRSEVQVLPPLP